MQFGLLQVAQGFRSPNNEQAPTLCMAAATGVSESTAFLMRCCLRVPSELLVGSLPASDGSTRAFPCGRQPCGHRLEPPPSTAQDWDVDLEESRPSDATATYAEFMIETAEGPQVPGPLLFAACLHRI